VTTQRRAARRFKVVCTIGTRPEAIKMAPVIRALRREPWADCRVLFTAQHRELVDPLLAFLEIRPDVDLDIMRPGQSLVDLTARLLGATAEALAREAPDMVLAQGDTTTVLAAGLAAFYLKIPFGHVEAGLRTGTLSAPFPEEMNRVVASRLGALHFAPTESARANLLREGIHPATIHVTGNTVIDALLETARRAVPIGVELDPKARLILVTAHRRDSFGEPIREICRAVAALHDRHPDVQFLWPVHPNPSIRPVVAGLLGDLPRVLIRDPLPYGAFVSAMARATIVLTDSGGVQEEAPALGKPVLVLRAESERPEAIESGVARLVGANAATILRETERLLTDPAALRAMSRGASPYGDGLASSRITRILAETLGVATADHRAAG
jgi:UDP-N-acetylglucosamine 2-epimerase (non-hydrolysing)